MLSGSVLKQFRTYFKKPTLLLLRDLPEWRWDINTEKTFWYLSCVIPPKEKDNWTEVLERVSIELNNFLKKI